jgi:hypothetical protein
VFFVVLIDVFLLVVSFLSSPSVDFVVFLCSCLSVSYVFFLLYTFSSGTMHMFSCIGESIFASSVPFVSILNHISIEEIIELKVVLLLILDLGLRLLRIDYCPSLFVVMFVVLSTAHLFLIFVFLVFHRFLYGFLQINCSFC